jgi:hypothetical protein
LQVFYPAIYSDHDYANTLRCHGVVLLPELNRRIMSVESFMRPKAKEEIIRSLRKMSLNEELLKMMENDQEAYSVITGILSLSGATPSEKVALVNRFAGIIRSMVVG